MFWPIATSDDGYGIAILERAFLLLGFEDCNDGILESGYEKVASSIRTLLGNCRTVRGRANSVVPRTSNMIRQTMSLAGFMARLCSS